MRARLKKIGLLHGDVTGHYGESTGKAIHGFQNKRGLPVTGIADQRTYDSLPSVTPPRRATSSTTATRHRPGSLY